MWVIYSIVAAILWGLDYSVTDMALKRINISTLLAIELCIGFIIMLGISVASGAYEADMAVILSSKRIIGYVVLIAIAFNVANALIVLSIGNKNATLAGLIEISYPLFIVFFSRILFNEYDLNGRIMIGGVLIILGVCFVLLFSN